MKCTNNLLKDIDTEALEAELAERKKRAVTAAIPLANPNYSALYTMIVDVVKEACENHYMDEDAKLYIYEAAMEAVYGVGFWDWFNKLDPND